MQGWTEPMVAFLRGMTGSAMVVEGYLTGVRGDGRHRDKKCQPGSQCGYDRND
jgi:hypothetical protein